MRGTFKDAQKELTKLLNAADEGTLPDPSSAILADYLRTWLNGPLGLSPKTLERYRELGERQIIPHLGATKLQKLKPEHIQHWHGALIGQGLSPRTVGHAHRVLRLVLQCAVKNGTLARNVATIHSPPKVEETEIEILSADQVADVLAKLNAHALFPIVALALATGMRRGELLGLQWGDIDLDTRVPFHALRHTHASTLIRAGIDVLTISRRLGHSAASMTLDVYGHLMGGADAAAAAAIGGVLGTPREQ